jgi:hypothetical protein
VYPLHRVAAPLAAVLLSIVPFGASSPQAVRDSAGVRIVSYDARFKPPRQWRVEPRPELEIGGADGTGPTEFSEIMGVVRLRDGTIVVANMHTNELRFFDAGGRHVRTAGRSGQGPGEFLQVYLLKLRADTLIAFDSRYGAELFSMDGKFLRLVTPPRLFETLYLSTPVGVFADGSFAYGAQRTRNIPPQGVSIDSSAIVHVSADGQKATLITWFAGYERNLNAESQGAERLAFAATGSRVVFPARTCVGFSRSYEIRCYAPAGTLQLITRRQTVRVPVSDSARRAWAAWYLRPGGESSGLPPPQVLERRERILRAKVYAREYPVFARFLEARTGELLVRDYRPEDDTHRGSSIAPDAPSTPTHWNVFAADGAFIADLTLPARFTPFEVGESYVLGVSRDDDDVERVTLLRLRR